ncbi:MAG: right-handed parallel beta-helix repeat-containing protein [Candidatus Hydrogenedentes bacterium]|nr:right-handed parallel beta-helix repeat-containing protein [Candidatus Hydrogenedentota bacterium]
MIPSVMRCVVAVGLVVWAVRGFGANISVADFPSVQAALDAHPGRMIEVPSGTYEISEPLHFETNGGGLFGYGTIVQTNPNARIIQIRNASGVRIVNLTLTRPEGRMDCAAEALFAEECGGLEVRGVRVIDNRSQRPTISFERCHESRIQDCAVKNYKALAIDDRTESDLYGYAFHVIDGVGINVSASNGIQILNNQVVDQNLFPTPETKERYRLGTFTEGKKPLKKGRLAPAGEYANNWHQGSAIVVSSPEITSHVLIAGNYIENAAQGIDIHADHVTCAHNVIKYAFIGIKFMHGARNVIISENNLSHNDLWGIVTLPGTLAHPAEAAQEGKPARGPNLTSGNVIANNIFSDFGFGYEYYNWEKGTPVVICLDSGQLPENPVMTDVLIQGNIIYDAGKDQILVEGVPTTVPPRYKYAVYVATNPPPQGLHFANNLFHPGSLGISNVELTP